MAESSYRVMDEKSLDEKSWKVIGAGGFGQVYKARHLQLRSDVAVKLLCLDNGSNSDRALLRECELMRRAESLHVIQVLGVFKGRLPSSPGIQIGLVMELMERGSLASLQKKLTPPLPWPLVFRLAHQVSLGMKYLHSLTPPIIHKDLKPDNVLLDAHLNVKITDFGLSKFSNCSTTANSKGAGTTSYMPPEALISLAYKSTPAFDVYSYGILLCSIVKGKEPYETNAAMITFHIPRGQRPSLEEVDLEQAPGLEDLVELMKRCWQHEPEERPLFPECTAVTEALYKKHEPGMKDAVHQVVTELDAVDNLNSIETDAGLGKQDAVDNWTPGETDAGLVSEKHFVDKNRCFLIKNVTAVDPILDLLLQEDIITNDDYENVASKSTHQEMTRKLYSFLKSSKAKDMFYKGLEEEEKLLLNKLDDAVRRPQPKASSEPGAVRETRPNASSEPDAVPRPRPKASSEPGVVRETRPNASSEPDAVRETRPNASSEPDAVPGPQPQASTPPPPPSRGGPPPPPPPSHGGRGAPPPLSPSRAPTSAPPPPPRSRPSVAGPPPPPPLGQMRQANQLTSPTPRSRSRSSSAASPPPLANTAPSWSDWEQLVDETGRPYFYNAMSGETSWKPPQGAPLSPYSQLMRASKEEEEEEEEGEESPSPTPRSRSSSAASPPPLANTAPSWSDWEQLVDESSGRPFFYNAMSGETSWEPPQGAPLSPYSQLMRASEEEEEEEEEGEESPVGRGGGGRRASEEDGPNLEKAGVLYKTKVCEHGKKVRKNWALSWTVLHGGVLTFFKAIKSASGASNKTNQIVPEVTVELRGATIGWAARDKSSKKNVIELKSKTGLEFLIQYDNDSIISDWHKVIVDTIRQLEYQDQHSEEEDDFCDKPADRDDRPVGTLDKRKASTSRQSISSHPSSSSSSAGETDQKKVRTKLIKFLMKQPTMQSLKDKGYIRDNVFGCHLATLCAQERTTVPSFVEKCIKAVENRGLDIDGLYRVSGNLAVIQKLRYKADHEELDLEDGQWEDVHVITGALKLFFRELPEPLFPYNLFNDFIAAIRTQDYNTKVAYMHQLVRSLPPPNRHTMELLFGHLRKVIECREDNRLTVQNVAIVFGPTLLRPEMESSNITMHMVFQNQIVEFVLNEYQNIFHSS